MKRELWLSNNRPYMLSFVIMFSTALWSLQLIFPVNDLSALNSGTGLLGFRIDQGFNNHLFPVLLGLPLYLLNVLVLYKINSRFQIVENSGYLLIWIYIFITGTDYRYLFLSNELLSTVILFISFYLFLESLNLRKANVNLFYTGFLIFAASVFYFPAILILGFYVLSLAFYKIFYWRDYANLISGVLSGLTITLGILYITESLYQFDYQMLFRKIFTGIDVPVFNILLMDFILVFLFFSSVMFLLRNFGFLKKIKRLYLKTLLFLSIVLTVIYLFSGMTVLFRFYLALPFVFIISYYLKNTKSTIIAISMNWFIFMLMFISEILAVLNNLSN